jgi:hypothetical protein
MNKELHKWAADGITIKWNKETERFSIWTEATGWFIVVSISDLTPGLIETLIEYKKELTKNSL